MSELGAFVLAVPLTAIIGGLLLAGLGMHRRMRLKELAYRERLAMIEKGLMPSPETDPARFERFFHDIPEPAVGEYRVKSRANRQRSAGIMLIGLGLGLACVIYFAGNNPGNALGVGGLIGFIGLAMLVNALMSSRDYVIAVAPPSATPSRSSTSDRPSPGL